MSTSTAPRNVRTESFACNARTGEQATRYFATFACNCPDCNDHGPHAGKGESARVSRPEAGNYSIVCAWCGATFAGPAVA